MSSALRSHHPSRMTAPPLTSVTSASDTASSEKKLLYMDSANYLENFFQPFDGWNLDAANQKVRAFCSAANRSGWTVVAFLDQATMTEEAQAKWRKRRVSEVRKGERRVPQGALRLLGDMFAAEGVTVRYSLEMDCDDTIASHAEADGASVLSADKDFLRYRNATYDLYKDYSISTKGKHLILVEQNKSESQSSSRDLGPPPKTGHHDAFRDCVEDGTYLRGSPSPLVQLGNMHIHVRPLRAALYHHMNIMGGVEEEFPVRNSDGECTWDKQHVMPDPEIADLLVSPAQAVSHFDHPRPPCVSAENWFKHQFAMRAVIAEICCGALQTTLLETLKPLMASVDPHIMTYRRRRPRTEIETAQ